MDLFDGGSIVLLQRKRIKRLIVILCCLLALLAIIAAAIHFGWIKLPSPVKEVLTVEAGTSEITKEMFLLKDGDSVTLVTDLSKIDLNKVGDYPISFTQKNKTYVSTLSIVDTTAPIVHTIDKQIYHDETAEASDFINKVTDLSPTTVAFKNDPPFGTVGTHQVEILVTDAHSNESTATANLTIIKDDQPPVFGKMEDIFVQIGGTISYKKNVTVSDNRDENVQYTVDSSSVDINTAGTYEVIYTATDSSGNVATAKRIVNVTVKPVINRELVDAMAKEVLDKIITSDMTNHQKIDTIFKWVRKNMVYTSSPEKEIPEAAYVAFTKKRGDCYNYYAMTTVLLDGCGIENMKIERSDSTRSHIWLLVNIGTGWYHYDTTPQHHLYPFSCFMKTDQEVWDYAKSRGDGRNDYYNFNASLYPQRATEKYSG